MQENYYFFAIFSYGVPKELCSNGESRGLGRPLIKWSGISHCDPSAECEVPLFPCGMKGTKNFWITQEKNYFFLF